MSEFELNEDRDEFEVLEDFAYNGSNNNKGKRSKWSTNFEKKTKRRGPEAIGPELDNYLKESKEWG